MKILFLLADDHGGAGLAALRLKSALEENGHEIHVESLHQSHSIGKQKLRIRNFKARINRKFEYHLLRNIGLNDGLYKSLKWLPLNPVANIRFENYDIVHLHWVNNGFFGLNHLNHIKPKVKILWTLHSMWPFSSPNHHFRTQSILDSKSRVFKLLVQLENNSWSKALDRVDGWVVPSSYMVELLPQDLCVRVIGNCLDSIHVQPIFNQEPTKRFAFVCAGDVFDPRKGLTELLETWIATSSSHEDAKLFIVGPKYEHNFSKHLVQLGIHENVHFIGALEAHEIRKFLKYIDALFVPSHEETFGQTILEALSVGTPVIVNKNLPSVNEFSVVTEILHKINFNNELEFIQSLQLVSQNRFSREINMKKIIEIFGPKPVADSIEVFYREFLK